MAIGRRCNQATQKASTWSWLRLRANVSYLLELIRLAELSEQLVRERMRQLGLALSLTDCRLLFALAEYSRGEPVAIGLPASEEDLCHRLGCQRTRIALRLKSLKASALLREVPRARGDLKRYQLTQEGLNFLGLFWMAQAAASVGVARRASQTVTVAQLRVLAELLEKR